MVCFWILENGMMMIMLWLRSKQELQERGGSKLRDEVPFLAGSLGAKSNIQGPGLLLSLSCLPLLYAVIYSVFERLKGGWVD